VSWRLKFRKGRSKKVMENGSLDGHLEKNGGRQTSTADFNREDLYVCGARKTRPGGSRGGPIRKRSEYSKRPTAQDYKKLKASREKSALRWGKTS